MCVVHGVCGVACVAVCVTGVVRVLQFILPSAICTESIDTIAAASTLGWLRLVGPLKL